MELFAASSASTTHLSGDPPNNRHLSHIEHPRSTAKIDHRYEPSPEVMQVVADGRRRSGMATKIEQIRRLLVRVQPWEQNIQVRAGPRALGLTTREHPRHAGRGAQQPRAAEPVLSMDEPHRRVAAASRLTAGTSAAQTTRGSGDSRLWRTCGLLRRALGRGERPPTTTRRRGRARARGGGARHCRRVRRAGEALVSRRRAARVSSVVCGSGSRAMCRAAPSM